MILPSLAYRPTVTHIRETILPARIVIAKSPCKENPIRSYNFAGLLAQRTSDSYMLLLYARSIAVFCNCLRQRLPYITQAPNFLRSGSETPRYAQDKRTDVANIILLLLQ